MGPFHWQSVGTFIVYATRNVLGDKLLFVLIVADDLKLEHRPADAQAVTSAVTAVLHAIGLVAAGEKWVLFLLRPPDLVGES